MSDLLDKTTKALGAAANMRLLKHNVIGGNIANAETPGFKAKKFDFEQTLSRAMDLEDMGRMHIDHEDHIPVGQGAISRVSADIYDNPDANITNDKNTVDMEKEMSAQAENEILYKTVLQLINKKLGAMKYAITEGGR